VTRLFAFVFALVPMLAGLANAEEGSISPLDPAAVELVELKCEYLSDPEGVDVPSPRFFWKNLLCAFRLRILAQEWLC
jgi:hypothetical protein